MELQGESAKLKSHVQTIGDTAVYANAYDVQIFVDGFTAIYMDKKDAKTLAEAILKAVEIV